MKKTYKNPTLEVIKIQTQQMLAQSVGVDSTPVDAVNAEIRGDEGFDWE